MKSRASTAAIPVDELRVGMYIHLDLGWMSHPFALSHFKIVSAEQLATLRGLGLSQVRWDPALSDPPDAVHASGAATAAPTPPSAAAAAAASANPSDTDDARHALQRRREEARLESERLAVCESQFNEAAQALRTLTAAVLDAPLQARDQAVALSQSLVDKMTGEHDLCIRVLGDVGGDRAATHALNVSILSLLMGRAFGWGPRELADLGVGALMHDVGKLELPERLRHRDEDFTPSEMRYHEEHVARGVAQARRMNLSAGALLVIGQHHEMADHSGFPLKIGSDRMTAAARIVALVNRYDRLCNPVRAHLALTPHEAVSLMFAQYQHKFEPTVLGAFVKMMGVYPPGSVVQLTDDRLALVTAVNSSRPLKPRVLVHQPGVPHDEALSLNLDAMPGLGIRRSLKPQSLPRDVLMALSPRQRLSYFFEPRAGSADGERQSPVGLAA